MSHVSYLEDMFKATTCRYFEDFKILNNTNLVEQS